MKQIAVFFLLSIVGLGVVAWADDVDVNLNSNNGSTGFSIKNNTVPPDTVILRAKSDGKVGIGTSNPQHKLDVNGNIGMPSNAYVNVGTTDGTSGHGFRDNAGTMEYKNNGGSWTPFNNGINSPYGFPSSSYTNAQIYYDHGAPSGSTYPNMPVMSIPKASDGYANALPMTIPSGTPYRCFTNGNIEITNASGVAITTNYPSAPSAQPVFFHILSGGAGTYRISMAVAVQGNSNQTLETEIFRSTSYSTWVTGVNDIESLSTIFEMTTNKYTSGSVTGIIDLAAGDYIAFFSRSLGNTNATSANVICVNLNLERIK